MGRESKGHQHRASHLLSIMRLSVPVIVLVWIAAAGTGMSRLKSGGSSFHALHQSSAAPMTRTAAAWPFRPRRHDDLGDNWSGYIVTGGPFTAVQGTWTIPAVTYAHYPAAPDVENTSAWIGIGGFNEPTLIQLGSEQDVTPDGVASYSVWYEVLPASSIRIDATRFVVNAGDTITTSLQCTATCTPKAKSTWVMSMSDGTLWKTAFTVQMIYPSSLASAEWIVEAPCLETCSNPIADFGYLANFNSITFTGLTANNANPNLSRSQNAMMLTDPQGKAWSVPSDPSGGNSFTMSFGTPGPS